MTSTRTLCCLVMTRPRRARGPGCVRRALRWISGSSGTTASWPACSWASRMDPRACSIRVWSVTPSSGKVAQPKLRPAKRLRQAPLEALAHEAVGVQQCVQLSAAGAAAERDAVGDAERLEQAPDRQLVDALEGRHQQVGGLLTAPAPGQVPLKVAVGLGLGLAHAGRSWSPGRERRRRRPRPRQGWTPRRRSGPSRPRSAAGRRSGP